MKRAYVTSMNNATTKKPLHSFVSIEECRELLGIDERDDALLFYLLESSTWTIEEYCMRRLFRRKVTEVFGRTKETVFILREYPVRSVCSVHVRSPHLLGEEQELCCEEYHYEPVTAENWSATFSLHLADDLAGVPKNVGVSYWAGYTPNDVPADLKSAQLELVSWRYARHKARKVGVVGDSGKERFENAMPENVKALLGPYMRRVI
jgi:uncharacterized phiE125 gp8 family phage protein